MNLLRITCLVFLPVLIAPAALANVECDEMSVSLFERAKRADQASKLEDARSLYTQAAERCDQSSYWLAVGDIWVNDFLGDNAEAVNEEGGPAIEAYGNAFEAARRDQNKVQGAAAARAMVELGLRAGDPIKANDWLIVAAELEPSNEALAELQTEVDFFRAELSTGEIETGFSQTRGLGQVHSLLMSGTAGSAYWDSQTDTAPVTTAYASEVEERSVSASLPPENPGGQRSINIPINFEANSTNTTAQTARNIENLALVLASGPESGEIIFIGHADVRGDADYNLWLSRKRADSVRLKLESLQPSLAGRISAVGQGEIEPIDKGNSDRAHANNRRLEVVIRD